MKNISLLYVFITIFSIIFAVFISFQLYSKYNITSGDSLEHYYHMRKYYDNKQFPVMGAHLISPELLIGSENVYNTNIARIPGSMFYLQYCILYFLSGENIELTRLLNYILINISPLVFLLFILKKFGLKIMSIMTALMVINVTFLYFQNEVYNTDTVFILSFRSITLILIYIYIIR